MWVGRDITVSSQDLIMPLYSLKPIAKPSSKSGADYESLALRSEGEDGNI